MPAVAYLLEKLCKSYVAAASRVWPGWKGNWDAFFPEVSTRIMSELVTLWGGSGDQPSSDAPGLLVERCRLDFNEPLTPRELGTLVHCTTCTAECGDYGIELRMGFQRRQIFELVLVE